MIDSKNRNDYFAVWTSIVSEGAWCTPNEPITSTHAVLEWPDPPPPIDASLFDEDAADAAAKAYGDAQTAAKWAAVSRRPSRSSTSGCQPS